MRKANDHTFGELFSGWLKDANLEGKFKSTRLVEAWPRLMGEMIARHTVSVRINDGTLHVILDSAPLRQELFQSREDIIRLLNEEAGSEVIKEIVFR